MTNWETRWYDTAICQYKTEYGGGGGTPEHFNAWYALYPYNDAVPSEDVWARMEWWRNHDHIAEYTEQAKVKGMWGETNAVRCLIDELDKADAIIKRLTEERS